MKKYIVYLGILAIGIVFGWLLFGGSSSEKAAPDHAVVWKTEQMWTCAMHPQIMQPEAGNCPICGMELIPTGSGSDGLLADQFKLTENAMALANIQTSVIGKGMVANNSIKLSGKIASNEEANTVQVSYFSGRIERLAVSFTGEEVKKGQLLTTIYSPELYAAQQELITSASLKASQPALYNAVRNKLKLWKLTESQINQIEETGKVKENFPVYATVSGTVTEKLVTQGDYVKQGQPLLKIANLNTVWGNFDVYENQIEHFKIGQEVRINTNAYPNKKFNGRVDFIDPILNTNSRTVTLRVVLNNQNDIFKPGMFVQAIIDGVSATNKDVLTIPVSAILWTGERSVVYVKADPNQAVFEMREVVLGMQLGEEYEVIEGLFAGDEIVTNGTFTVDAAAQLQGKKSMMNRDGDKTTAGHEGHAAAQNTATNSAAEHFNMNKRILVSEVFQKQLNKVFENYIDLKDALVAGDAKNAEADAKSITSSLAAVEMGLLTDANAHSYWMLLKEEIKSSATSISNTSEIKTQRMHFKHLSTHLIDALQLYGVNSKVFVEFCPMADNNKGAYWLSREEKIFNPYFGEAMLSCGEVKHIIE